MKKINFGLLITPLFFLVYKLFFSMSPFNPNGKYDKEMVSLLDSIGIYQNTEHDLLNFIADKKDGLSNSQLGTLYMNSKPLFGKTDEQMPKALIWICVENNVRKMMSYAVNDSTRMDSNRKSNIVSYYTKQGFDKNSSGFICYELAKAHDSIVNRNIKLNKTFTKEQQTLLLKILGKPIKNQIALKNVIDSIPNYEKILNAEKMEELRGLMFTTMLDRGDYEDEITYRGYDKSRLKRFVEVIRFNDTSSYKIVKEYLRDYMSDEIIRDIEDDIRGKRKVAYLDSSTFYTDVIKPVLNESLINQK